MTRYRWSAFIFVSITLQPSYALASDEYVDLLNELVRGKAITHASYARLLSKHNINKVDGITSKTNLYSQHQKQNTENNINGHENILVLKKRITPESILDKNFASSSQSIPTPVRSTPAAFAGHYTPGSGITLDVGQVSLNLTAFLNAFYTFDQPGKRSATIYGGLSTGASGFDSSSIRDGLLPAGVILKLSTVQLGWNLSTVFGIYPGIGNSVSGASNANSGGSSKAFGTPGIDFRKIYLTFGKSGVGEFKLGRDIGLFAQDAVLNDATLFGVGAVGSNTDPANTSLGHIGMGYLYPDFMPQITYTTENFSGFSASGGIFTPLEAYNYAGGGISAGSSSSTMPMFQWQINKKFRWKGISGKFWTSGLWEKQDHIAIEDIKIKKSVTAAAEDVGGVVNLGKISLTGYYYRGKGVGMTGLFFDGISQNGHSRVSSGYYGQILFKPVKKLSMIASYGKSNLNHETGDSVDMVKDNTSEIGTIRYSFLKNLDFVFEYGHFTSTSYRHENTHNNTYSAGAFIQF